LRIAIVGSRGFPHVYSGYETLVGRLAPALAARGHDVTVYCHRGLFAERPSRVGDVRLVYTRGIRTKVLDQLTHSLTATVHAVRQPYDVVLYVNSANGPFGLLLKLAGRRSAINVDGLEWKRPKWRGLGARYFRFASWLATKSFDGIITDADAMAAIYRQEFGAESVTIAYGADLGDSEQANLLQAFGLRPGDYYLIVGRLIPDNNVDLLVRGMERSGSQRRLVVVGDVPYRDRYAAQVRSTVDPRVVFTGYVRDQALLKELYCNAYAYLHGHEFGGTNPALLKALGFGCCVLALDTPFAREVLGQQYGRFFARSVESIAAAIDAIDEDANAAACMRGRARQRITERYTWSRIVDQYEEYLMTLIARRGVERSYGAPAGGTE